MTVKPPWLQELEDDEEDMCLDAIIAGFIVLVASIICAVALFVTLGYFWPQIMALHESVRFAP
jgi:hypothetical protein